VENVRKLHKDKKAFDRWIWIIRAICWAESRYGGGGGEGHPDLDPMQCGHPKDMWKTIVKQEASGQIVNRGWDYVKTPTTFYVSNALATITNPIR
jgi:hypothetical protein